VPPCTWKAFGEYGDRPFDAAFMERTFETFWTHHGRATTEWTNLMLGPPPPHLQQILGAASQFTAIGNRYVAASWRRSRRSSSGLSSTTRRHS
jgi:hypothetical protein